MNTYLTFKMGKEYYATKVDHVNSIMESPDNITRLPDMQNSVLGIINLRGQALPVVDLPDNLGITKTSTKGNNFILVMDVVIEKEKVALGIQVDEVEEVIEIRDNEIKTPPKISMTKDNGFISGVYQKGGKFIMISNMNKIFSSDEIKDLKGCENAA